MEKIGKEINSKPLWEEISKTYVDALETPYHKHRLEVIYQLLPSELFAENKKILDFGCGDAVLFPMFLKNGAEIFGIDISETIIELGRQRLQKLEYDTQIINQGDITSLKKIESNSLDAILCFNTLAYFTDFEENQFYIEANRVLKQGGYLAVSHSNELFDLFTLNRYTCEFFKRNFLKEISDEDKIKALITNSEQPSKYSTYNVRENPLSYKFKLHKYGLEEVDQKFSNYYELPPLAMKYMNKDKTFNFSEKPYPSTSGHSEDSAWKLMFMCSTYMSLSTKL